MIAMRARLLSGAFAGWCAAAALAGADWTQWGGPTRDFRVSEAKLPKAMPTPPRKLWTRDLGDGYSMILAEAGRLYTMYRSGGDEVVICLNADTGEVAWEHKYAAPLPDDMNKDFGIGPRSTPLIVGDRLFAVGASAKLHCLDKKTGAVSWSQDLMQRFGATSLTWGYSSSPLAYKDTIILPVGGDGKGLMSFKQENGSVVWSSVDAPNAYCSPMLINVDGQEQCVVMLATGAVGVDPATGAEYWSHPHKTDYDVNATSPVWGSDNLLFLTSSYRTGSRMLKLAQSGGNTTVTELWKDNKNGVQHGSAIRIGDWIYGSVGRGGPAFLVAMNAQNGEVKWKERGFAKSTSLLADGKLLVLDEDGALGVVSVSPEGMKVHWKTEVLEKIAWSAPTLVGDRLFLRDKRRIVALDLKGS